MRQSRAVVLLVFLSLFSSLAFAAFGNGGGGGGGGGSSGGGSSGGTPIGSVVLTSPNGGEKFFAGDAVSVSWLATSSCAAFRIDLSTNAGNTWQTISENASGTSARVSLPNTPVERAYFRITCFDSFGRETAKDDGDASFQILSAAEKTVSTTSPTPIAVALPAETTPSPTVAAEEETFCSKLATLRERIACKLERGEPNALSPESCRELPSERKANCVKFYSDTAPCFELQSSSWAACAKAKLNLGKISSEKTSCHREAGCLKELHWKVVALTKFRLYGLEERAEKLMDNGAGKQTVVDFIASIEVKKRLLDSANSGEEKKQLVFEAQLLWSEFKKKALQEIKASRGD